MHFSSKYLINVFNTRYRRHLSLLSIRYTHKSSLNLWNEELNTDIKLKIEKHWKDNVVRNKPPQDEDSFYILPMFPYPSGNLHMGHVRVYTISDAIARFNKLCGKHVIHPMGWDAFGLPAENAAIERNIPPDEWTHKNISNMKKQLQQLAFDFDWDRELSTCDPEYYKWTQYIFLKLYENGLAYQDKATVNWDPVDRTVLADEQVDAEGRSWRSGARVQRRVLTQWFVKTTRFARQLFRGLDDPALENWKDIVNLQKHWIGECDGVVVTFTAVANGEKKTLDVWTAEPAKLIHAKFITLSPSNIIVQELGSDSGKIDVKVYNPVTDAELPVYVSEHDRYPEGRDVYVAAPALDGEDEDLAHSLGVPWSRDTGTIDVEKDSLKAVEIAQNKKAGGYFVSSKLKDWLISRQRYWGTPIPIVHCATCGAVPVPCEELPVRLPPRGSAGGGRSLQEDAEWARCRCPRCGGGARRETDTMDTFVDSSWYYSRFLDPANDHAPFAPARARLPVNMYVGGKEHAVLHLYYARFMSHFMHSLGWTRSAEPFKRLIVQGMVMGQSYKLKSGKYLPPEEVYKDGKVYKQKETNEAVTVQWEKMSKSKYNGVNPENLLNEYGCDTTRMFILADVPPVTSRNWSDATFPGILNWQKRLWLTVREFLRARSDPPPAEAVAPEERARHDAELRRARNYYTATATYHFRHTQMLSVAISRLQSITGALRRNVPAGVAAHSAEYERALAALVVMTSPAAPHFAAELWAGLCSAPGRLTAAVDWEAPLADQTWPTVDQDFGLSFQCKVDGADRCDIQLPASQLGRLSRDEALRVMLGRPEVARRTRGGVAGARLDLFPGCRAVLHVRTHRKENVKTTQPIEAKQ